MMTLPDRVRPRLALAAMMLASASCTGSRSAGAAQPPSPSAEPSASAAARVLPLRSVEPGGDFGDLAALGALIGDARVVALGEPAHGVHEPLAFRNRLLEYLVREHGFTAIAVEAPFPESRRLAEHVAGGLGTAEDAVAENRAWWPVPVDENLQLVRWMRDHNTGAGRGRPVRFYAIDLSYTGPWGSRPTTAALEAALAYVRRVDPPAARTLASTFEPLLPRLADPAIPFSRQEHDALTAAIDDLVALLERERVAYLAAAPAADYEWAHRAALVARQGDRMFRIAPAGDPNGPVPPNAWRAVNARDAAMAENVLWALGQEGPGGRLLVVAHNVHVQGTPAVAGPWAAFERMPTAMGQHLRASLGDGLVIIGMSDAASVDTWAAGALPAGAAIGRTASPPFILDLRRTGERTAFDALLVVDSLTTVHPAGP
jgi:erythromycin esterase